MWTWGGRVYNWKRYLDNMKAMGMDSVVFWHYHAPANAAHIRDYADALGIEAIWGFNWGWNDPVCLDSEADMQLWRKRVLDLIDQEYAPINARAICFQTGGTEFGGSCRLDCDACRQAVQTGVGPLFVKFVTPIIEAVKQRMPDLRIFANVHCGGLTHSYQALAQLPIDVSIMYEDLPGPGKLMEIPFSYDWSPEKYFEMATGDPTLQPSTLDMVGKMCQLRGADEDVAFILKGFPCHWGGSDPMLLEDFELEPLSVMHQPWWKHSAASCEKGLDQALKVFRVIADSPARCKTVLLLVEAGLWEWQRYYAAVLVCEALHNPYRDPPEIIAAAKEKATA